MYLLDTNIVIYLLDGNAEIDVLLSGLHQHQFPISVITRFEVMVGFEHHQLTLESAENYLDEFQNIDVNADIVREAVLLERKYEKKMSFKDLIIAATAKHHHLTLITADRSFENFEGLQILMYKP